jgi:hypothetical protein
MYRNPGSRGRAPFVAGHGVHQRDDKVRSAREVPQLIIAAQQVTGKLLEPPLIHRRFSGERGDQPAHKLDGAVDAAFEIGADQVGLCEYIRPRRLLQNKAVLVIGAKTVRRTFL